MCGLYVNPPENAVVWSVDEKSQIQAKSRVNPTCPAISGVPERRDYGYKPRHRRALRRAQNVHTGTIESQVTNSTRSEHFVEFLPHLVSVTPRRRKLHCIVDNLSTHTTEAVEKFLKKHRGRVVLHFTAHVGWLNQVGCISVAAMALNRRDSL